MKIVIDISEEKYEYIKGLYNDCTDHQTTLVLYDAIRNGTPLPKGHGDLIDRNTITVEEDVYFQNYIIHAPTIIEADKQEAVQNDK